jgi:hypothetical protein
MEAVVDEEGATAVVEYKVNNEKEKKNSKRKLTIVMGGRWRIDGWWLNVKKVKRDFDFKVSNCQSTKSHDRFGLSFKLLYRRDSAIVRAAARSEGKVGV